MVLLSCQLLIETAIGCGVNLFRRRESINDHQYWQRQEHTEFLNEFWALDVERLPNFELVLTSTEVSARIGG